MKLSWNEIGTLICWNEKGRHPSSCIKHHQNTAALYKQCLKRSCAMINWKAEQSYFYNISFSVLIITFYFALEKAGVTVEAEVVEDVVVSAEVGAVDCPTVEAKAQFLRRAKDEPNLFFCLFLQLSSSMAQRMKQNISIGSSRSWAQVGLIHSRWTDHLWPSSFRAHVEPIKIWDLFHEWMKQNLHPWVRVDQAIRPLPSKTLNILVGLSLKLISLCNHN